MNDNPLLKEIREIRERIAHEYGYDIDKINEAAWKIGERHEKERKARLVAERGPGSLETLSSNR